MAAPLSGAQQEQIKSELFAGSKIQAIKTYRAATGADLKTAKAAVEALEADLRATSPERFITPAAKTGCLPLLLLLLISAALFAAWASA
ncbi:MAG TPA: ribosomal protein L7/L12 [Tepidisphaeraceae bacterium]|jgi:hypothetical protein